MGGTHQADSYEWLMIKREMVNVMVEKTPIWGCLAFLTQVFLFNYLVGDLFRSRSCACC